MHVRDGKRQADAMTFMRRLAALACALVACAGDPVSAGVFDPAGPVGAAQKTILLDALAIMLLIVVPTIVGTLFIVWWFRAGNTRATRLPDFVYSGRVELVTWSIPVLVVLLLGGFAWVGSHDLDPARPLSSDQKPLNVQVVSLDWKWLFIYPDERVAAVNELVVPVGRPLTLSLTSASVMNTFFVPQLGSMIYTMNGMTTRLNLRADRQGIFEGLSAHFSGDGFPGMRFAVRAVPPDAFVDWTKAATTSGDALDRGAYDRLAVQSLNVAPTTYRAVDDGLFAAIVDQSIAPAPGPDAAAPQTRVSPRRAASDDRAGLEALARASGAANVALCTAANPRGATPRRDF